MEPSHSQNLGAAEECHSCESGWTMYLGSPTHDDDDDDDDEEQEGEVEDRIKGCDAEDESDDSMASDASSGPSSRHRGDSKGNQLVKESEIAEKKVEKKGTEFMDHRGIKVEVEKVRKNNCVRKRK